MVTCCAEVKVPPFGEKVGTAADATPMVYVAEPTALGDEYPGATAMALTVSEEDTVIEFTVPWLFCGAGVTGYAFVVPVIG